MAEHRTPQQYLKMIVDALDHGDVDCALSTFQTMQSVLPDSPFLPLADFYVQLGQNAMKTAAERLVQAQKNVLPLRQIFKAELALAEAAGDETGERMTLLKMAAAQHINFQQRLRLSILSYRTDDFSMSCWALSEAFRTQLHANRLAGACLDLVQTCPGLIQSVLPVLMKRSSDDPQPAQIMFAVHFREGRVDDAIAMLWSAYNINAEARLLSEHISFIWGSGYRGDFNHQIWDALETAILKPNVNKKIAPDLYFLLLWYFKKSGQLEKFTSTLKAIDDVVQGYSIPEYAPFLTDENVAGNVVKSSTIKLIRTGKWEEARDRTNDPDTRRVLTDACVLKAALCGGPLMHEPSWKDDFVVSGQDRPNGTAVVFTGFADGFGKFPLSVLDVFLNARGINGIYCRDFNRLLYCCGIESLGDSFYATRDKLKSYLEEHAPGQPVYTIGHSAGGAAALMFAPYLETRSSLLFSPWVTLDWDFANRVLGDYRGKRIGELIKKDLDANLLDLDLTMNRTHPDYNVTVYCSEESVEDCSHADFIGRYDNCDVIKVANQSSHSVIKPAAGQFGLDAIIANAFRLEPLL